MARPALPSLSLRTALYVAVICLAILGFEGWREWTAYGAALNRAGLEAQNLAHSLRQHAEDTYEMADTAVSMVAFEAQAIDDDPDELIRADSFIRRMIAGSPRLHSITIIDRNGRRIASTSSEASSGDYGSVKFFQNHRASSSLGTFYGPPIRTSDGALVTTVSRRFNNPDGTFAGVVLATIDSRYFAQVYDVIDVGRRGAINLFDTAGHLLSRSPYQATLIGSNMSGRELFAQELAKSNTGAYQFTSPIDGESRIGGYDKSVSFPLVAVVGLSRDEALATWWEGAILRGLLALALAGTIALLGLRLADQIRRRHRSEAVLEQKESEFRLLAESASDLVERFDREGTRTYISPALERLTGYRPDELIGLNAFDVIHDDDRPAVVAAADRLRSGASEQETVAFRRLHRDGREIWLETSLRVAAETGGGFSVVGVTRDITERKRLEMKLEAMAMRDGLTGLANRRAFDAAIVAELARARRSGAPVSLLMIDADRFKRFNDDNGHLAGDACLKAIASIVALAARRTTDLAARYGGEELALLLPESDAAGARHIANDICRQVQALAIPHQRNLPWKVATVSIGVATIDPRRDDASHDGPWLISAADLALYSAKAQGRNQVVAAPSSTRARLVGVL